MKMIYVLAEGWTEEKFVNEILSKFFDPQRYSISATVVETKVAPSGKKHKGGITAFAKFEKHLNRILHQTPKDGVITTMIDLFHLPADFPGQNLITPNNSPYEKAAKIENALFSQFNDKRLIPYVQVHEFEALLFSYPAAFTQLFPDSVNSLQSIRAGFPNPEYINSEEAPSYRIIDVIPGYQKVADGISIAKNISIETMIAECPHFAEWLQKLSA